MSLPISTLGVALMTLQVDMKVLRVHYGGYTLVSRKRSVRIYTYTGSSDSDRSSVTGSIVNNGGRLYIDGFVFL